jgi:hypothetical protein
MQLLIDLIAELLHLNHHNKVLVQLTMIELQFPPVIIISGLILLTSLKFLKTAIDVHERHKHLDLLTIQIQNVTQKLYFEGPLLYKQYIIHLHMQQQIFEECCKVCGQISYAHISFTASAKRSPSCDALSVA